jgi:hypothetical protein
MGESPWSFNKLPQTAGNIRAATLLWISTHTGREFDLARRFYSDTIMTHPEHEAVRLSNFNSDLHQAT